MAIDKDIDRGANDRGRQEQIVHDLLHNEGGDAPRLNWTLERRARFGESCSPRCRGSKRATINFVRANRTNGPVGLMHAHDE